MNKFATETSPIRERVPRLNAQKAQQRKDVVEIILIVSKQAQHKHLNWGPTDGPSSRCPKSTARLEHVGHAILDEMPLVEHDAPEDLVKEHRVSIRASVFRRHHA
jgi:hypothetical protein